MAAELASGAPTSDWAAGVPAEVMGMIASRLKHPDNLFLSDMPFADATTGYERKSVANGRVVSKHWASKLPLGVTSVYARGRAPGWSTTMLDAVKSLTWEVRPSGRTALFTGLHGTAFTSSLPSIEFLHVILRPDETFIADIVDTLVGHGTLTGLRIDGQLHDSDNDSDDDSDSDYDIVRDVARLTYLQKLEVNSVVVTDRGLQALSSLTALTHLRVTAGKRVTDSCIESLCGNLVCLRDLTLHDFALITDESLRWLAELADIGELVSLVILGSPLITREGWAAFREDRRRSTCNKKLESVWTDR